jgi:YfiH family protein
MRARGDLPIVAWPAFDPYLVDAFVTTRHGGVSTGRYESLNLGLHVADEHASVIENRERVASRLGIGLDNFVFCEQAHDRNVVVVGAGDRGRGARSLDTAVPRTDALVTTSPDVVLVVMVADCVPLVLLEPAAGILACVHAGWGGTVRGVTRQAVATMTDLGGRAHRIVAGIGPAIGPDRYQVGDDVAAAARDAFGGEVSDVIRPDGTGRWLFDLWAANRRQLRESGVPEGQIHTADLATGAGTPFFSHRAEQPCGRFAAVARLRGTASS